MTREELAAGIAALSSDELRELAAYAHNERADFYGCVVRWVFRDATHDVALLERAIAKKLLFAHTYGVGGDRLREILTMPAAHFEEQARHAEQAMLRVREKLRASGAKQIGPDYFLVHEGGEQKNDNEMVSPRPSIRTYRVVDIDDGETISTVEIAHDTSLIDQIDLYLTDHDCKLVSARPIPRILTFTDFTNWFKRED